MKFLRAATILAILLHPTESNVFTGGIDTDSVECTAIEVHGYSPPGQEEIPEQYQCVTDEGKILFFDDSSAAMLTSNRSVPFSTGVTKATVPLGSIVGNTIVNGRARGAITFRNEDHDDSRRRLTRTGQQTVLVIRVTDTSGNEPSQDNAKLYNDIFTDENNLAVRYDECSNGQLTFAPTTGTGVVNGVITVQTNSDLSTVSWGECGDIATDLTFGIFADFTMIVCPDVVDFEGAAAWGQMPGDISWYLSSYASAPIVQVHEVGHNLGHHHSGEDGVTYADPTCNMGNQGSWSDTGSVFCFNAAKTWANNWYSSYHVTVNPSSGYDGELVGIDAVRDGSIQQGQDVVMKIDLATDLYVMFNSQYGANSGVPDYGNQVVVVSQSGLYYTTSAVEARLSAGQTATISTAGIKVCSITNPSAALPGGNAHVLVYPSSQSAPSCDHTPVSPPTSPPVSTPVSTPTYSPMTMPPVGSPPSYYPVSTPVYSPVSTPTYSPMTMPPVGSPSSYYPVSTPDSSPVTTPTNPPDSSPVTTPTNPPFSSPVTTPTNPPFSSPVTTPTNPPFSSPVTTPTNPPFSSPVTSPTNPPVSEPSVEQCQDFKWQFQFGSKKRTCIFISRKNTFKRCKQPGVADRCPVTCGKDCQCYDKVGKFRLNNGTNRKQKCAWAARKNTEKRCKMNSVYTNCPTICNAC